MSKNPLTKGESSDNSEIVKGEVVVVNSKGKPVKLNIDPIEALRKPAVILAEVATGALAAPNLSIIAGRLVQAGIKGNLLQQLGRELYKMREDGKIKEDYFASNNGSASLNDLLDLIDSEAPDSEKFKAIKAIFFTEISLDTSEADRFIAHHLLKICFQLDSLDILILKACYNIYNSGKDGAFYSRIRAYTDWVREVKSKIGIEFEELVDLSDDRLVNLELITPRQHGDKSGVKIRPYFRLTKLGTALCNFITRYP